MAIKAIIFDCFGVLYHGARGFVLDQAPAAVRPRVNELFDQADYGMISTNEFIHQVAEVLQQAPADIERMLSSQYRRNDALVSQLASLRERYKVALLSNVNDTLIGRLFSDEELRQLFDEVVMSSSVGMIKPHPEIYQLTADRLGVAPQECIMIDDLSANIEGAQAVGMKGIICRSTDQCLADLRTRGIEV